MAQDTGGIGAGDLHPTGVNAMQPFTGRQYALPINALRHPHTRGLSRVLFRASSKWLNNTQNQQRQDQQQTFRYACGNGTTQFAATTWQYAIITSSGMANQPLPRLAFR
jgi:hypothetical protein